MAVPRPLLLALAGAVLLAVTFAMTRQGVEEVPAPPEPTAAQPKPASPANPAKAPKPAKPAKAAKPAKPAKRPPAAAAPAAAPAAKPAPAAPKPKKPPTPAVKVTVAPGKDPGTAVGLPMNVARALARRKGVVLLFSDSRAADDTATGQAVRGLRGNRRVKVFSDSISNLGDYNRLVGGLGISQSPSVVIVRRDLTARVMEGFVDAGSLRQELRDFL